MRDWVHSVQVCLAWLGLCTLCATLLAEASPSVVFFERGSANFATSENAVGYFAEPGNNHFLTHSIAEGSGVWSPVYRGNKCYDTAQIAELPPPWGIGGSMTWPIPNEYSSVATEAHADSQLNDTFVSLYNAMNPTNITLAAFTNEVTSNRFALLDYYKAWRPSAPDSFMADWLTNLVHAVVPDDVDANGTNFWLRTADKG